MIDFKTFVWLLPLVFMLHDFEEIIFFKSWLNRNKEKLSRRFPTISQRMLPRVENLSVEAFSLAVAEEFLLLSAVTILSALFDSYLLWLAVFMGFFIHLFVHLIQGIIFRSYVPAIITAIISLIYCIFSFCFIIENNLFSISDIVLWSFIGCAIVVVNLILLINWRLGSIKKASENNCPT